MYDFYVDGNLISANRSFMSPDVNSLMYISFHNYDPSQAWYDEIVINDPLPTPTPTPTPVCVNHGDVDFNGDVTAGDAQITFSIVLAAYTPTYDEECAADCTGDGSITDYTYDDYFLNIVEIKDALGNLTKGDIDYNIIEPFRLIDQNGNTSEVLYDPLGIVIVSFSYGTVLDGNNAVQQYGNGFSGSIFSFSQCSEVWQR